MLKHTTRHQLIEMCFCSVMMWTVNQICNTFIIFKSAVQRVLNYNGIDQEEDRVIKKPRRPEFLRANDVDWGKAPTSQSEAKGCWCTCSYVGSPRYWSHVRQAMRKCRRRGGFFQRKIPVSGEIKKSRDLLRPWSCGKTLPVIFGYKEYAQYFEPWVSSFFFFFTDVVSAWSRALFASKWSLEVSWWLFWSLKSFGPTKKSEVDLWESNFNSLWQ